MIMQEQQEQIRSRSKTSQHEQTSLRQSLYFRTRNVPKNNKRKQKDKVNYLSNNYWDLIFQESVDPTKDKEKGRIQAKKIKSIMISFSQLSKFNVGVVREFLYKILKLNSSIRVLIITNKIQDQIHVIDELTKSDLNFSFKIQESVGNFRSQGQNRTRLVISRTKIYVHGKLWVIKYKQNEKNQLRVCVATSNFTTFDWTIGGNGFWKRQFASLKNNKQKDNSNKDFKNSIQEFLDYALSTNLFKIVQQDMKIDFNRYYFDRLDNVHLIICPPGLCGRRDRGLQKIRIEVAKINIEYAQNNKRWDTSRNINIISPFISIGGQRQGNRHVFQGLLNHFITAFHGIQPEHIRTSHRTHPEYVKYIEPLRIFELTNKEVYLANKYEIQTKDKKINKQKNHLLDLLQGIASMRKDTSNRQQAFEIIKGLPDFAAVHRIQTQQSDHRKYSNFTAHHTKLVACTHYSDKNESKVQLKPDILLIGSQNFTPTSWGYYDENGEVIYDNLELGVLIQVPLNENLTDYIPIRFNTSNFPDTVGKTKIQLSQIFNLTPNNAKFSDEKRYEIFEQFVKKDQVCQTYKRQMRQTFQIKAKYQFSDRQYEQYQLFIDQPIRSVQNLGIDYAQNSVQFIKRSLYGQRSWFDFLKERLGGNFKEGPQWIADIALRQQGSKKIRAIWCFSLPTFYTLKKLSDRDISILRLDKADLANIQSRNRITFYQTQIKKGFEEIAKKLNRQRISSQF